MLRQYPATEQQYWPDRSHECIKNPMFVLQFKTLKLSHTEHYIHRLFRALAALNEQLKHSPLFYIYIQQFPLKWVDQR